MSGKTNFNQDEKNAKYPGSGTSDITVTREGQSHKFEVSEYSLSFRWTDLDGGAERLYFNYGSLSNGENKFVATTSLPEYRDASGVIHQPTSGDITVNAIGTPFQIQHNADFYVTFDEGAIVIQGVFKVDAVL